MSTDLTEGQSFGAYRLVQVAGTGGMGIVYRAEQRSLGRTVALKVIRPEIAQSGDYRLRFLREARLAAAVDHPHVVSVYEVGEYAGRLYLAMQWIDGLELRTLLDRQERLDPERAVRTGVQLAAALNAVHETGLLHRDVKPANVLVRDIGGRDHAYLADFGIARMSEAERDLTRTGWVMGTSGYLSPEQIQGYQPDPRSDLYALGCVVFETLTGRPPFDAANDQAMLWAHATSPRPLASAIYPPLGPRYDMFLSSALAIDPRDRFQSGQDFAEALHSAHVRQSGIHPSMPATAPAKPEPAPDTQPPSRSAARPAPAGRPSGEPGPTVTRTMAPSSTTPSPGASDSNADVPTRAVPSGSRPHPGPAAATPRRGKADRSGPSSPVVPPTEVRRSSQVAWYRRLTGYRRLWLGLVLVLAGWIPLLADVPHRIGYSGSELYKNDNLTHKISLALLVPIVLGALLVLSAVISAIRRAGASGDQSLPSRGLARVSRTRRPARRPRCRSPYSWHRPCRSRTSCCSRTRTSRFPPRWSSCPG